jgi:ATP-dependent RNA helicase DeaD
MEEGYNADSLHGELSQAQRDAVMQKFRIRNLQILVATDVAARGLDVDDLTHIINYGLPDDTESYTHRSGRTGRAGKTGTSIAIINLREKGKMREIERIIGKKFAPGEMPTNKQICEKQLLKVIDDIEKVKVNEEEIADYMPSIYRKLEWLDKEDIIKRMVSLEFNRFLEYYRDREEIEIPKENRGERNTAGYERRDRGSSYDKTGRKAESGFTRIFISLGKADNFFPAQLIDLINKNTQHRIRLGRIDLMRSFSFFEVEEKQTQAVLKGLSNAAFNGRKITVEVAGEESPVKGKNIKRKYDPPIGSKKENRKKEKPSREERGYTNARGPKKKDDWRQFFKGEEPDFTEEGWAKRKPKK